MILVIVTRTGKMMAKHLLQECLTYVQQSKLFWPTVALFEDKLYADVSRLKLNAALNTFQLTLAVHEEEEMCLLCPVMCPVSVLAYIVG